ncbi:YjgN family protein [Flavisphingomonas formosensis]|uniref:YjgN family protein n=1 Tax=Flavisphingomonas formosensis TaxID=861534 RepID=UPI0012FB59B0|nr:YjgN family protein [Sphingomonas formosensis]
MQLEGGGEDAFAFTGTWRGYLPIALGNLALTIATLGVYRFWGKARERRYLWRHTWFLDDRLEWAGTGREMFVGFLIVMLIVSPALIFLNFGFQAMVMRGHGVAAGILLALVYAFLTLLRGIARFRGLRYRLSRTYWHGIRGGSEDSGSHYAWAHVWKTAAGYAPLALLVPWSMVALWNQRWRAMSFGRQRFEADAASRPLFGRYLLFYMAPFLLVALSFFQLATTGGLLGAGVIVYTEAPFWVKLLLFLAVTTSIYLLIGMIGVAYYSAYFREAVAGLSWGDMRFSFSARTDDWVSLLLGDAVIVIGTLGLGFAFIGYRHWSFFIRHLEAHGPVDDAALGQSTTRAPREAEGFIDAFDVGAL